MSAHPSKPSLWDPPGGILIWIIVAVELVTFGCGLIVFAVQRAAEPAVFAAGRALLNQQAALVNTFVLITGGWCMVNALEARRRAARPAAFRWCSAALIASGVFLAIKLWEYSAKLDHGLTLRHDSFFTLYWLLTGFHFMHVAVAAVILACFTFGLRARGTAPEPDSMEAGAVFWHLCDLIWLLLYPVLYLLA